MKGATAMILPRLAAAFAAASIAAAWAADPPAAIKVGGACDYTGATKIIGVELCPGVADYIALTNRKGGVAGHRIAYKEIDHAYLVPRAVEAYDEFRRDGVVAVMNYGVPTLYGLTTRFMEDRIPVFNTGTGRSDAIDGEVWPYIFPGTASYWSQAGAALKYLKDNGAKKGTKVAYIYYDNPAGREAIPLLEEVVRREGYVLRKFPVQPPGLEMAPEITAIARDFKADWVIAGLFGKSPSVSIKEFRRAGYPLNRVVSFSYGAGDADVAEAGWDVAQGYLGIQWAAVGRNVPVVQEIVKMRRDEGREVPSYVGSAYYNRGVLVGAVIVEGIRLAIQNQGLPLTGDKVRKGFESIRSFPAQGLAPPLTITPQDHEGGGYMRVFQVKGTEWVPVSDWIRGYRDEVMAQVRKANNK